MDFYFKNTKYGNDGLRVVSSISFEKEEYRSFYELLYNFIHSLTLKESVTLNDRECAYGEAVYFKWIGTVWTNYEYPHNDGWADTQHSLEVIIFKKDTDIIFTKTYIGIYELYMIEQSKGWDYVKKYLLEFLTNAGFIVEPDDR